MNRKRTALIAVVLGLVLATAFLPRVPQDPNYHQFADQRAFFGIPNALNVFSNLPFLIAGALGFAAIWSGRAMFVEPRERWPYYACFAGITLTAFGSSWYHWSPSNETLVWDRLPMALGFMGLLCAFVAERISIRAGLLLLLPLLATGVGSVFYWRATELAGAGDLRPYLLVQFGPIILLPLTMWWFPGPYTASLHMLYVIGLYALAKVFEFADSGIYRATDRVVSGHTLKHLAAAWACYEIVRMIQKREHRQSAYSA